jgi:hypothetical protein
LEEDLVNYFSGSSDSGDSVELVGIEKGTSSTVSAGGVVDGYSYFGNEPNPDPEDDSPLSRQSEWIPQFAKQRTTGYSKERKINTFTDALEVETDVLLGQFPPQHLVTLFNYFMLDMRNKKRWKLENIALTVFDLSKHVNDWVEARKPRRIDSAVDAFSVMYQHFDNVVTRKIQERRSSAAATLRAVERSRQRRPLPNNFMFTLRMVSGRQRLLVFGHVTHLFNCLFNKFSILQRADFPCPGCGHEMVVKLKLQGDLDKETREYEKTHKKKVEKAKRDGKEGAQLPCRTNVPEMTYGCGCVSMFTYGTRIAATSWHACKEKGSITETDGKPICDICSCDCAIGAFKQSEIVELRIRRVQEQESVAKAANAPTDHIFSRANASLASMTKRSVTEAAKIISQSLSDPSMKNIVSATASAMSRKQPKSEEILYNLQHWQGAPSTRLKHTDVCIRELKGSGLGNEKGTRYYRNRLSQAGFGSSSVICLDAMSPGDGGGKLPAGGRGVQETDDLWIKEFMKRDESEDLED